MACLLKVQNRQICESVRHIGVVWPVHGLVDAQRALIQRLRLVVCAALVVQDGQVGQGVCQVGVVGPVQGLPLPQLHQMEGLLLAHACAALHI